MANRQERKAAKRRMIKNLTSLPTRGWRQSIAAKRNTVSAKKKR